MKNQQLTNPQDIAFVITGCLLAFSSLMAFLFSMSTSLSNVFYTFGGVFLGIGFICLGFREEFKNEKKVAP